MNGLLLLVLACQTGTAVPRSLSELARDGPQSALVARVRTDPDEARDALRELFALAVGSSDSTAHALGDAERLAAAYEIAWQDSFFVTQVARFRTSSPEQRRAKVAVDSLRRAGNAALGRHGVTAAVVLWRRSVRQAVAIGDTAGMAAGLGNIGRGFYERGELDSADMYWARSQELAERVGDLRTAGNAIGNRASVRKDRGDLRQADSLYVRSSTLRVRSGDPRGLAADQNNRGLIAQTLGDVAGARRAFESALAANRAAGRSGAAATNLINLGNLAWSAGDGFGAEARYTEALALYESDGDRRGTAEVWRDIGLARSTRGDYRAAQTALKRSLADYRAVGSPAEIAAVRRSLADVCLAMGDVEGAARELRQVQGAVGSHADATGLAARLALSRGDLETLLNHSVQADRLYRQAQLLFRHANDGDGEAEALQARGYLSLAGENYSEGRDLLQRSLRAQRSADPRTRARTRLLIGYALREGGDSPGARTAMTLALDTLRAVHDVVGQAAVLAAMGELELGAGIGLTAESLYHRGLELIRTTTAPTVSWQLHAGLAEALAARGALTESAAELRAGIADVEHVARRLTLEQRRPAYLADKWEVYAQLAVLERRRGRVEAAFDASERLRARQLLDLLARGRVSWPAEHSDTITAREQELRLRIAELTHRLETPAGGVSLRERDDAPDAVVREALGHAQAEYAALLADIQDSHPAYARLVRGEVAPVTDITRQLAPDEVLLEYLVTDSTTLAFVLTDDTTRVLDLGVGHHALAALVDFTRGALSHPAQRGGGAGAAAWHVPLERLYQLLIDPIEASGSLRDKQTLIIVPHAELHYVPFAALRRSSEPHTFLVERYVITTVPSASVWLELRRRHDARPGHGVLALAPRVDALPGSRTEVAAIQRIFGESARSIVGLPATKQLLRANAAERDIVHLATYGVLNKHNPLFSYVELAPQRGDDGRLELHEVFTLELHARLVVLSACQTAIGSGALADVPAGDDWQGLTEGFLYAGAARVLATLWPVEDRSTAALMEQFYQELTAGVPEGDALARAQRLALRNSTTADPFYWAGFTLSGGP